jgi:RNA polymerase sigma-70 factor, ECF subfamily
VAVSANIKRFRRDRDGDSFRGWLWVITKNKIRDHFRRLQTQPQGQGGTDALQRLAQLPHQPPESSDTLGLENDQSGLEHRALRLAIRAEFEDQTWEAFRKTTIEGRRAAEVAHELGMSAAAVYKAKSRVMRRIRQSIGDLVE